MKNRDVLFGSLLVLLATPAAAQAASPCFVAFVHGSGEKFDDQSPAPESLENYWTPDGSSWNSFTYYAGRQWDQDRGCIIHRVGYDGYAEWWSDRAAGRVAASPNQFIEDNQIGDGQLVIIAHSMGGVVARYLINSGVPGAPYYNEYAWLDPRMAYDLRGRGRA